MLDSRLKNGSRKYQVLWAVKEWVPYVYAHAMPSIRRAQLVNRSMADAFDYLGALVEQEADDPDPADPNDASEEDQPSEEDEPGTMEVTVVGAEEFALGEIRAPRLPCGRAIRPLPLS